MAVGQHPCPQGVALRQDAQQQMLAAHAAVAQGGGLLQRAGDGGLGPLGKLFIAFHESAPYMEYLDYLPARQGEKREARRREQENYRQIFG